MTDTHEQREVLVNRLIDGELAPGMVRDLESRAAADSAFGREIEQARSLKSLLADASLTAPALLKARLRRIPNQGRTRHRAGLRRLRNRWPVAVAASLVPMGLGILMLLPREPSAAQIAEARRDLGITMTYLARIGRRTNETIGESLKDVSDLVASHTMPILGEHLTISKGEASDAPD